MPHQTGQANSLEGSPFIYFASHLAPVILAAEVVVQSKTSAVKSMANRPTAVRLRAGGWMSLGGEFGPPTRVGVHDRGSDRSSQLQLVASTDTDPGKDDTQSVSSH